MTTPFFFKQAGSYDGADEVKSMPDEVQAQFLVALASIWPLGKDERDSIPKALERVAEESFCEPEEIAFRHFVLARHEDNSELFDFWYAPSGNSGAFFHVGTMDEADVTMSQSFQVRDQRWGGTQKKGREREQLLQLVEQIDEAWSANKGWLKL